MFLSKRSLGGGAAIAVGMAVVLAPVGIPAQVGVADSRSAFVGTVVDPSHQAIPGAVVVLEDLTRRVTRRATTDRQGRFDFRELPAGDYEAEVAVVGFALVRNQVMLAGPLVEQAVELAIGPVTETFTVIAGEPANETLGRERGETESCIPRVDPDTQSPIGGQVRPPRMLTRVSPAFPEHLRDADVGGDVRLSGRITANGSLADLSIVEAGHPDLAAAAEDAVRQWTWEESLLNCAPVDVPVAVTVRFLASGR